MRFVAVVILIGTALYLSADPRAASAASEHERASLRGLSGFVVVIQNLRPEAKADGLSEDSIRSAVELILRSSGILILEPTAKIPYIYVRVSTFKNLEGGFHSVGIKVELNQWLGQPEWSGYGATWQQSWLGLVGARRIREMIGEVEQMVKQFANDFLAANPK